MGKVKEKVEEEGFNLLEEKPQAQNEESKVPQNDVYNVLGSLKLQYIVKKSRNGKTNLQLQLQSKEQLNTLIANIGKIQNALNDSEYVVTPIASRSPYTLTLVITKTSSILKIAYLSGYIKNVNMSIPVSQSTISSLVTIVNALTNSEIGKKLLSVSQLSQNTNNTENLL